MIILTRKISFLKIFQKYFCKFPDHYYHYYVRLSSMHWHARLYIFSCSFTLALLSTIGGSYFPVTTTISFLSWMRIICFVRIVGAIPMSEWVERERKKVREQKRLFSIIWENTTHLDDDDDIISSVDDEWEKEDFC